MSEMVNDNNVNNKKQEIIYNIMLYSFLTINYCWMLGDQDLYMKQ